MPYSDRKVQRESDVAQEVPQKEITVAVTERDVDVLLSLQEHRYLSVSQIRALHFPSQQTANRRVRALDGADYISIFRAPGFDERVVTLSEKGALLVAEQLSVPLSELGWNKKREQPKDYYFLKHFLAVTDFRIALAEACRRTEDLQLVGFIPEYEGETTAKGGIRKRIRDVVSDAGRGGSKITHTPDGVFALKKGQKTALLFLEVDRGTEVLADEERGFAKTIRFYLHYLRSSGYQRYVKEFGVFEPFRAFRVLVVTTSKKRLANMRRLGGNIDFEPAHAKRFIWLSHREAVNADTILTPIWTALAPSDERRYGIT